MKSRYRLNVFLAALLAAASLAACDSVLDVTPDDEVSSDQAFASARNAEAVLLGAYDGLQLSGNYGGAAYMAADFTTTNADFRGSFNTFVELEGYNVIETNASVTTIYDDAYDVINRTNEIVANANTENIDDISPELAGQFRAEARFLRALMYHNLLRWFALSISPLADGGNPDAPGVPLILDPARDPLELEGQSRASVGAVYDQIVADLTTSIDLFQNSGNPSATGQRATLGASQALLARVRLYQGQWQNAADMATAVIGAEPGMEPTGAFSLVNNIESAFVTSVTPEDVFVVVNSTDDNSGTNDFPSSFYLPQALGGRGDLVATDEAVELYPENDARQNDLIYVVGEGPSRVFGPSDEECFDSEIACWTYKFRSADFADNVRVIRLAEPYLVRAEANARLNNEDEALADLNVIRTRSGLLPFGDGSDEDDDGEDDSVVFDGDIVEQTLLERRRELAYEGKYRHTILRTGQPLVDEVTGVAPDFQRILPFSQAVLDGNSAIEQNPGY